MLERFWFGMNVFFKELVASWKAKELLWGFVLAIMVVSLYNSRKVDAENLALGPQNTSAIELWDGKPFTGYSPPTIKQLVGELSRTSSAGEQNSYWLWLGNSQLHTINQKKDGDHLAPYWLREELACADCAMPIGVSLPNANLQEHLLLDRYIGQHLTVKGVIVPLVFDDLREEGIREELTGFVDAQLEADLNKFPAGRTIVQNVKQLAQKGAAVSMNAGSGADDDFQKRLERALEKGMGQYFPLWDQRSNLKAIFAIDLYYARNWLLNIKPTTVRKIIEPRYAHNMEALRGLLMSAQLDQREMLVYIAPIRQDLPLPYDIKRYAEWKHEVEALARRYEARFLNLEKLVPPGYWGSYHNDDVDFMHFQDAGHRLLAKEILKEISG